MVLAGAAGLHARAAAAVVRAAGDFGSSVTLTDLDRDAGRAADARSILALLSLAARSGDRIAVRADGPDAAAALSAVTDALGNRSVGVSR